MFGYKERQGEIQIVDAEICFNLSAAILTSTKFKIQKGNLPMKKWITENGFVSCKRSEATALLIIGQKNADTFSWITGKYKNIWIKPK